jgi:transcriptional regulator with XRE-family HTH domain
VIVILAGGDALKLCFHRRLDRRLIGLEPELPSFASRFEIRLLERIGSVRELGEGFAIHLHGVARSLRFCFDFGLGGCCHGQLSKCVSVKVSKSMSSSTENFDSFSDFIHKVRIRSGLTQEKFGEEIGVTKQTISHWENGRGAARNEALPRLASKTGYSVDFIAALKYDNTEFVSESQSSGNARLTTSLYKVPGVSLATAGRGKDFSDICAQMEWQIETDCSDENAFALEIEGTSMAPRWPHGERLVASPKKKIEENKPVFVKLNDGRVFFKLYHEHGPNQIRLESANAIQNPDGTKKWEDIIVDRDQIAWIYAVWGRMERY